MIEYGQEILQKNNSVKLIGSPKERGGVLSFTIEGVHPHDIATILDETGVAIRAGHHCCQILHDKLGIPASARASLGVLYGKKKWLEQLPPYQGGGGMINEVKKDGISYGDLPNKYEAGTMATAQVIAFNESIKFMEKV